MSELAPSRLYVAAPLSEGTPVTLPRDQSHYLVNVMRRAAGDPVLVFNGRDGEWRAEITRAEKRTVTLAVFEQTRAQTPEPDVWLLFAPLKKDRTDFVVEKATELGVGRIVPILTERTQTMRVNTQRLQATALEAAEQSRRLSVPEIAEAVALADFLAAWPADRRLIYLDETGAGAPLAEVLAAGTQSLGFVIGPEGGFAPAELDALDKLAFSVGADLGPRILRAETAATAALAIRQAIEDATLYPSATATSS